MSLVKQGTLTRPEHLVPPPIHNALMFGRSTCCEICVYGCVYVHTCMYMYIYMCIYMYIDVCV